MSRGFGQQQAAIPKYDIGPILESFGAQLPYHVTGRWQQMRCPFHGEDRNPSASVNLSTNRFNCFSCGVKGDAIDLLREQHGLDFKAAHEEAARISNTDVRRGGSGGHVTFGEQGGYGGAARVCF